MQVQLEVASGNKSGQCIPITGSKFIIGRAEDCHLKPRSELISRYHCAIIQEEGFVTIRDLGSKNGVYLNGERVTLEHELKDGDKLSIGPLEFVARVSADGKSTSTSRPSVAEAPAGEAVEQPAQLVEPVSSTPVPASPDQKTATQAHDNMDSSDDVASWLEGDGENDIGAAETISVQLGFGRAAQDDDEIIIAPPNKANDDATKTASQAAVKKEGSREAAANRLKNFFKGGR